MEEISRIAARLRPGGDPQGPLVAGFDAFEMIRAACRACENRHPGLLAAFMLAAGAAVEGRNALLAVPSFPPGGSVPRGAADAADADVGEVAAALAALAALLAGRLSGAAADGDPVDRAGCAAAARAGRRIEYLLAGPAPW
jgi:hypothetical protein